MLRDGKRPKKILDIFTPSSVKWSTRAESQSIVIVLYNTVEFFGTLSSTRQPRGDHNISLVTNQQHSSSISFQTFQPSIIIIERAVSPECQY